MEHTFEQQVQMARHLERQGECWEQYVRDPEMRRRIREAM